MGKFDGILLLSDIDGTIARDGVVSEANKSAVEYFKANGGLFVFSTGRMPSYIERLGVEPNAPVIATNGTIIYDLKHNKTLKEFLMPPSAVDAVCEMTEKYDVVRWYSFTKRGEVEFFKGEKNVFDGFEKEMYKVVFVFEREEDAIEAKRTMGEKYMDLAFERSWPVGLEMRLGAAGKGVCLKYLKEYTGAELAVAAGDYENDLGMLAAADISYAPSDALPSVKEAADRIGVAFEENLIEYIVKELENKI